MQSKIEKTFTVPEAPEVVWAFLRDPFRVVTCVPGAQLTEQVDEHTYRGAVSMKVGPVVTDFQGEVHLDLRDDAARELRLSGTGTDTKGKGSASMKMVGRVQAAEGGGTEVYSSMEVSVVGRLAQFGARMMQDISNRMFAQFTECLAGSLAAAPAGGAEDAPAPAPPEPIRALPLFLSALLGMLKRLFGRG